MSDRRVDGFFYGLYMDLEILREAGVTPSNPRRAFESEPRSAIRTTPSVFGALSASSTFRRSTSPPWRERGAGLRPYRR